MFSSQSRVLKQCSELSSEQALPEAALIHAIKGREQMANTSPAMVKLELIRSSLCFCWWLIYTPSAAPPRIVNISVQTRQDHSFYAKCTAEGEPLPTLTWSGPPASNGSSVQSSSHQITKELQRLAQDGKYTCTAINSLGRAEGAVYFYKFKAGGSSWILILLFVALGIKFLGLVMVLGAGAFWKEGRCHSLRPQSICFQAAKDQHL